MDSYKILFLSERIECFQNKSKRTCHSLNCICFFNKTFDCWSQNRSRDYITNRTVWFRSRTICPNIWCLPSSNCCQNPTKLEYFAGVVCKCFKFNYTFDGWIRDEILNEKSTNSRSGGERESLNWIKFDFAYDVQESFRSGNSFNPQIFQLALSNFKWSILWRLNW